MEMKIMKAALVVLTVLLAVMVASPAFASSSEAGKYEHPHRKHHKHPHHKHHPRHKAGKPYDHAHYKHHNNHWHGRHHKPPEPAPDTEAPSTEIVSGLRGSARVGETVRYTFRAVDPDENSQYVAADYFECRTWGVDSGATWDEAHGKGVPWEPCSGNLSHTYVVSDHSYQTFEVRAVDHAGNVDPTPAFHHYETYNW